MDIADRIERALNGICPVYTGVPEFSDDEPKEYIIYSIIERGADYAEGENRVNQYMISLSVFTKSLNFALYERIKAAMYAAGFGYGGGGMTGTDAIYPHTTQYYLDFVGVEERG